MTSVWFRSHVQISLDRSLVRNSSTLLNTKESIYFTKNNISAFLEKRNKKINYFFTNENANMSAVRDDVVKSDRLMLGQKRY